MRKLLPLILISLFTSSCSHFVFMNFKVLSCNIEDRSVVITFSHEPEFNSLTQSIIFSKDKTQINGTFTINNKKCIFTPQEVLEPYHEYELRILSTCKNIHGTFIENEFVQTRNTKVKTSPLEIIDSTQSSQELQFKFNSPVEPYSFYKNFNIEPDLPNKIIWNNSNDTVTLKFTKNPEINTRYKITISGDLTDIYNNNLKDKQIYYLNNDIKLTESLEYKVYAVYENNKIELSKDLQNENINCKSHLLFCFEKEIDFSDFNSNINITPALLYKTEFDYESNKNVKLTFNENPQFNSNITITVNDKIKSKDCSSHTKTKMFELSFNNSKNRPIKFHSILWHLPDQNLLLNSNNNPSNCIFNAITYPKSKTLNTTVYYIFETSPQADSLDLYSVLENININTTNSCIKNQLTECKIIPLNQIESDLYNIIRQNIIPFYTDSNYIAAQFNLDITNTENSGLIIFNIEKYLSDSSGNQLESSVNFIVNKK